MRLARSEPHKKDKYTVTQQIVGTIASDLLEWFLDHHLCRIAISASIDGSTSEKIAPPVVLFGSTDSDVRCCPHPATMGYTAKDLADMELNDYHIFMLRWLTKAIDAGLCSCIVCHKQLTNTDPASPWDGIFVERELVCWMLIHFDCKRGLPREYKGRHPFDLHPKEAETLNISEVN